MTIAENADDRLTYKAYASGTITAGSEPVPSSAPAATGGQVLRHVSHTLSLTKDYFAPNEKRTDRQTAMGRHGTKRAPGTISGLLSPLTYADLFEASFRGTWSAAAVTITPSMATSVSADNPTSKFTFAAGDPEALGVQVGDVIRFADLADTDNNAKNFVVLSFGGTSNREVTVYPAPDTMSPDTTFTLTTQGRSLIIPSSAHVSRLFAFEHYNQAADIARLYTEARIGGFQLRLPPNDNAGIDFTLLSRNRKVYEATDAPFFTSPAAQTTTDFCAAVNGLLQVNGETLGVVSGLNINFAMDPSGPSVVGSELMPDIFLPDANVSGDFSAFLDADAVDLIQNFDDEDEISLLGYFTTSDEPAAHAITAFLPRIKLNTAQESDDQSGGKLVNFQFMAARYNGAVAGYPDSTIRLTDTAVS